MTPPRVDTPLPRPNQTSPCRPPKTPTHPPQVNTSRRVSTPQNRQLAHPKPTAPPRESTPQTVDPQPHHPAKRPVIVSTPRNANSPPSQHITTRADPTQRQLTHTKRAHSNASRLHGTSTHRPQADASLCVSTPATVDTRSCPPIAPRDQRYQRKRQSTPPRARLDRAGRQLIGSSRRTAAPTSERRRAALGDLIRRPVRNACHGDVALHREPGSVCQTA